MFTIVGLTVAVAAALLRGGRVANAGTARLHLLPVLVVVAAVDLASPLLGPGGGPATPTLVAALVVQQGAVVAVGLANLTRPGMPVVVLGATANALAVIANHGMPVAAGAVERLGGDPARLVFQGSHHLATDHTRLAWLTDVLPVPVLDVVVSPGDLLVVAGLVVVIDELLRPRGRGGRAWRRAA